MRLQCGGTQTGYLLLGQLRRRSSAVVNQRAQQLITAQPHPVRTITVDNGTKFHEYAALEHVAGTRFYFARHIKLGLAIVRAA